MLLYALLHLSGYDLPMAELMRFRQLHSKTPGHPEVGVTPGIETTTGPLGQGLANAIGMAIAERVLGAQFNRPEFPIVDHYTYVSVGDGCLMEGISHEACSLAGVLGLGKLIVLYDDNEVSIDGKVQAWFADDTPKRFEAYRWHVIPAVDGHDAGAIRSAIAESREVKDRPSLIVFKTVIGYGAPQAGTAACHGVPLGEEGVATARERLQWRHPPFVIPEEISSGWNARTRGTAYESEWNSLFHDYRKYHPEQALEFERRQRGRLPTEWNAHAMAYISRISVQSARIATRKASQETLNAFGPLLPELLGGSADLSESNLTAWKGSEGQGSKAITAASPDRNYLNYGVREFAMSAIMNGIALHGGFIPYGGTFLVFSDYARNAVRMAALMGVGSIFVYSHDSIGLGEDGPTHQAVEHAASLRLIPKLSVWRPADALETAVAWRAAIERRDGPTALLLSRQPLPPLPDGPGRVEGIQRGGYVLLDCEGTPELIVLATGSEVALARAAAAELALGGAKVRVVSMPSTDVFDAQDEHYRETVLPHAVRRRVAIEAGAADYWWKYVGLDGTVIGLKRFGESAPAEAVFTHLGFSIENVIARVHELLSRDNKEATQMSETVE
jgi:transketolase